MRVARSLDMRKLFLPPTIVFLLVAAFAAYHTFLDPGGRITPREAAPFLLLGLGGAAIFAGIGYLTRVNWRARTLGFTWLGLVTGVLGVDLLRRNQPWPLLVPPVVFCAWLLVEWIARERGRRSRRTASPCRRLPTHRPRPSRT
jgi:hypothetical protein